mmetsp:Transcript_12368/g.26924  ORF Transcript_12368/g.26924 Transcript_12368/m.26924 type:complete len:201 (-) Transcript_12368:304-906(-)|eukprot:CAMPEP_0116896066 /NCGR_PEP_ID=MMETSP0467-20121206/5408_1 /TAXON_ID=283647 /ORGANISM="Mesodinium pulex, Strain SPMC105" /LENGTH=200 /DNA_ID=CAMNT_0004567061 /DNA_START=1456 /DNA_END=2058 /DNA_ORIENTATION=+
MVGDKKRDSVLVLIDVFQFEYLPIVAEHFFTQVLRQQLNYFDFGVPALVYSAKLQILSIDELFHGIALHVTKRKRGNMYFYSVVVLDFVPLGLKVLLQYSPVPEFLLVDFFACGHSLAVVFPEFVLIFDFVGELDKLFGLLVDFANQLGTDGSLDLDGSLLVDVLLVATLDAVEQVTFLGLDQFVSGECSQHFPVNLDHV